MSESLYEFLANAVLVLHAAIAVFIVSGPFLFVLGHHKKLGWRWANQLSVRLIHLAAIALVIAEAWLGIACPLTMLEMHLRSLAGLPGYGGSFIAYWIQALLFYEASEWVFVLAYSVFGLFVLATWWYLPPNRKPRDDKSVFR